MVFGDALPLIPNQTLNRKYNGHSRSYSVTGKYSYYRKCSSWGWLFQTPVIKLKITVISSNFSNDLLGPNHLIFFCMDKYLISERIL